LRVSLLAGGVHAHKSFSSLFWNRNELVVGQTQVRKNVSM
jgi:hypothetical protein